MELHNTTEFLRWAHKDKLNRSEDFILKSLDPTQSVMDAGTGGGRFLHVLKSRGFNGLTGFDFSTELINVARTRDVSGSIQFDVSGAENLPYADEQFDQCLYLQQIISLIELKESRLLALKELKRVLKKGGVAYLSLLFRGPREKTPVGFLLKSYLAFVRTFVHRNVPLSMQPLLKLGGRPNWMFFGDARPYVCWYSFKEAVDDIQKAGLIIQGVATDHQLEQGEWLKPDDLDGKVLKGFLYIKCGKDTQTRER